MEIVYINNKNCLELEALPVSPILQALSFTLMKLCSILTVNLNSLFIINVRFLSIRRIIGWLNALKALNEVC